MPAPGSCTSTSLLAAAGPGCWAALVLLLVRTVSTSVSLSEDVSALALAVRVLALALPGVLLVASTDPVRLADALTVHWRVSTRFAYGALAALRLVPLLATEWQTIRLARRARGIEPGRNPVAHVRLFAGTAFALLVAAVRRGTRLATAMDARGFDSGTVRTNARGSRLRRRDAAYLGGAAGICALALALSVGTGSWHPVLG